METIHDVIRSALFYARGDMPERILADLQSAGYVIRPASELEALAEGLNAARNTISVLEASHRARETDKILTGQDSPTKILTDAIAFANTRQGEVFRDLRAALDLIGRLASELAWLREVLAGGEPLHPLPSMTSGQSTNAVINAIVGRLNKLHEQGEA